MTSTPAQHHDDISDDDISALVDIAKTAGTDLSDDKHARLPALLERGLIAPSRSDDDGRKRYKLTPDGQAALDARGVGANEA